MLEPRQGLHRTRTLSTSSNRRDGSSERDKDLKLTFTAEPKIDGLRRRCAMRTMFWCAGRRERRRNGRRGYHREPQDDRRHSASPRGPGWPSAIEIRGEVYLTYAEVPGAEGGSQSRRRAKTTSTRATAAGSLRQKDPSVTASRNLQFFAYALGQRRKTQHPRSMRRCDALCRLGLPSAR